MQTTHGIRNPQDWRRLYLLQHPLTATLSAFAVLAAFALAAQPGWLAQTAIAEVLPAHFEWMWLTMFGTGGSLCWAGYWRLDARREAAGLVLQTTCYAVQLLTVLVVGLSPLVAFFVSGLTIGHGLRAVVILTRPEVRPWERRN